jgi:CRP-like cAMP-binding protein
VKVAAGEILFELGDDADHMYIISSGLVDVLKGEQHLARLGGGDCFGEMALLDRTTRSATICAVEHTQLVAIARDEFYELLELYPTVTRAIVDTLVERLRKALR